MKYGYARVSTKEQNEARQMDALREAGVDTIFVDKVSGKDFNRPQWIALMSALQAGDVLYMLSLDRMGRNYDDIQEQWRNITRVVGADIVILDMPILNTKTGVGGVTGRFIADLVLQVLAYVAQSEREKIKERQTQGIKAAMDRGVRFGRPPVAVPDNWDEICDSYRRKKIRRREAAERANMNVNTFETKFLKWRKENGK